MAGLTEPDRDGKVGFSCGLTESDRDGKVRFSCGLTESDRDGMGVGPGYKKSLRFGGFTINYWWGRVEMAV